MGNAEQKNILVVDDEQEVRQFLVMALEDEGFHVDTACSGVEALEKIKQKTPDLISLDLVMPQGAGIRLVHELKKNPEWSRIPYLVVTGHARDDLGKADFDELTMSGPGVYLEKPIKPKEYVNAVRRILHMETDETKPNAESSQNLKQEISKMLESADETKLAEIKKMLEGQQ